MASKTLTQMPPVDSNLKRAFENAVRDIYRAGLDGKAVSYRTPIVQRASVRVDSPASAEKKALYDAAKALSQLWKVSAGPTR